VTGQIIYFIVEYGGILDLGGHQVPMPLSAFECHSRPQMEAVDSTLDAQAAAAVVSSIPTSTILATPPTDALPVDAAVPAPTGTCAHLVIRFDENQLAQFPSLDENWYASTEWRPGVQSFWDALGLGPANSAKNAPAPAYIRMSDLLKRSIAPIGLGEGNVDDILADLARGYIKYILATFVAVPSDALFLIPYDAFDLEHSTEMLTIDSAVTDELLNGAPRVPRSAIAAPAADNSAVEAEASAFWRAQGFLKAWDEKSADAFAPLPADGNLTAGAHITDTATVTAP
jgi:hypothetical protein